MSDQSPRPEPGSEGGREPQPSSSDPSAGKQGTPADGTTPDRIQESPEDSKPAGPDAQNADDDDAGANAGQVVDEEAEDDDDDDDDDDDEDDEDEEPRLKYARLTPHLAAVYRNGDATSALLVAGDKMILGTHNGNIHVLQLPTLQPARIYHAHSASVTSISISPYPPPLPVEQPELSLRSQSSLPRPASRQSDVSSTAAKSRRPREPLVVPKVPSNEIYIATSSMDGNVCVQSLIDIKDVQLRNFARPVQAVALSPDYRADRTYLSGGLAGQLILTIGGGSGRSTSTTTGTAAATASGWLGSIGLVNAGGKDTVLHSGEGSISCIKWSLSGKYVVWLNEHGIKIMRSRLHLAATDSEDAWRRLGHIDRPQSDEWDTMASVWKGRAEWIDEKAVDIDEPAPKPRPLVTSPAADMLREQAFLGSKLVERLLVGWGSTIWIIHVHPGAGGAPRNPGQKSIGRAEIAKILRMDCIISGISLYTRNLLLVLASCSQGVDDEGEAGSSPQTADQVAKGGSNKRPNNPPPELRLIDLDSQAEIDKDGLNVSRYQRLSSGDYHLGVLLANHATPAASSKGALEALAGIGSDVWNAAIKPKSFFGSAASIRSRESGDDSGSGSRTASTAPTARIGVGALPAVHPSLSKPGTKIFIHSPYDCILATKRDLADHLAWLLEREQYQSAWELLDENPEIVSAPLDKPNASALTSLSKHSTDMDEHEDEESAADSTQGGADAVAEREKRRIGELWIQDLVEAGDWTKAGQICGRVLTRPDRWEKWVWTFAGAKKFDEITDQIPSRPMQPPLPSTIYEVVLGHYIQSNKPRFAELLDRWSTDLFDSSAVITALEKQLQYRDVRQDSIDDGEKGRDWRIVVASLARLHEATGAHREALRWYIKIHDADSAFRLIKEGHLVEAVADDIPSFIGLRVPPRRRDYMSEEELAEATSEAITLLVDEALHGLVRPHVVVDQLQSKGLLLYLYFYFRGLWRGLGIEEHIGEKTDRLVMDSQSLVDLFADLAVHLFATFDRRLLMEFLKSSTLYDFDKAVQECEARDYDDELVYLYSKTGQMKRALYLIIDRLADVQKAIEFAKDQDDPDLWEDLLNYSMDKPTFIRALLEQAGTAINPITLVRRIPERLEIPGLRDGLVHMLREHELQHSISSGVARVLRSELAAAQNELRAGQSRGIKFEVVPEADWQAATAANGAGPGKKWTATGGRAAAPGRGRGLPRGRCAGCGEAFSEDEVETLLGFACRHVFHLSHLLEMLHQPRAEVDGQGEDSEVGSRHRIGIKVMRARLLKDKLMDGCPVCHESEEA